MIARLESRGSDGGDSPYLLEDPNSAVWVPEDDAELPAMVFSTAEEAYAAYRRSCAVGEARKWRREEALKRLGKT